MDSVQKGLLVCYIHYAMYLSSRGTKPGILDVEEADREKDRGSRVEANKGDQRKLLESKSRSPKAGSWGS